MPSSQKIAPLTQLPDILKQYTKDCIRAQPSDIIQWSTDYFGTMSNGGFRAQKSKEENSSSLPPCKPTLTPGLLRALHAQVTPFIELQNLRHKGALKNLLHDNVITSDQPLKAKPELNFVDGVPSYIKIVNGFLKMIVVGHEVLYDVPNNVQVNGRLIVPAKEVEQKWNDLGLPADTLRRIMTVGAFGVEIEWMKFFALCCSTLDPNITNAMRYAFEILSSKEDGGRIPYTTFRFLYSYLAMIDGEIHRSQIEKMLNNIERQVAENDGLVKVSDFISC